MTQRLLKYAVKLAATNSEMPCTATISIGEFIEFRIRRYVIHPQRSSTTSTMTNSRSRIPKIFQRWPLVSTTLRRKLLIGPILSTTQHGGAIDQIIQRAGRNTIQRINVIQASPSAAGIN